MSQQINLILPEFKPHFDWLALPVVVAGALVSLLLVAVLGGAAAWQAGQLAQRDAAVKAQLQALQQQVAQLGLTLSARKGDQQLDAQIEAARQATAERQEVLAAVSGAATGEAGYSAMLQTFAQHTVDGVWLTAFGFAGREVEIRGRLSDAALLPVYIAKLNGAAAFAGRRFATLDMKAVTPTLATDVTAESKSQPNKRAGPPYTEFALRTERIEPEPAR